MSEKIFINEAIKTWGQETGNADVTDKINVFTLQMPAVLQRHGLRIWASTNRKTSKALV